jgi:hypothetical protein
MENKIGEKLVELIISIPQLLIACGVSFLSGNVWLWLIYTYFKKSNKGVTYLKSGWAKMGLGMLWNTLFLIPSYFIKFGFNTNVDGKILSIIGFTLLIASGMQAFATLLVIQLKK